MRTYHNKPCGLIKSGHVDHQHHWPRQLSALWPNKKWTRGPSTSLATSAATWSDTSPAMWTRHVDKTHQLPAWQTSSGRLTDGKS